MKFLGLAALAVLILGGIWWLSRLIAGVTRNNDSTHGGGGIGSAA